MLNRMMTVGNRWTKGNMDRIYVNNEAMARLMDTAASNGVEIRRHFNRRERQNLKMFYDIVKDEVVVTAGDPEAKEELINALMALVMPEEVETTEEAETTETEENNTVSLEAEFDNLIDTDGKTYMVDGEELTTSQLAKKYYPDNYRESYQRWLESRQQKTA